MCLILFAYQYHSDYPLIVAANRDEYYDRPTRNAHFWEDSPTLYAGRDLEAGGTWMGITKNARFAAVTNFRESANLSQAQYSRPLLSRGSLTSDFLTQNMSPQEYLALITPNKNRFAGFNLLIGNHRQLLYCSNRSIKSAPITPGIHGLSNGVLNEPWPKVETGKRALKEMLNRTTIDPTQILDILLDTTQASSNLPDTGIGTELEKVLSSRFIQTEKYGTRASTLLIINKYNKVTIWEKNFIPNEKIQKTQFTFKES